MQWNWVAIQVMLMHNKLMTINIIANPSFNDYTKKNEMKKREVLDFQNFIDVSIMYWKITKLPIEVDQIK